MISFYAIIDSMNKTPRKSHQYSVRDVSEQTDHRLREAAAEYGLSLNQTILKVIDRGLNLENKATKRRDLSAFTGILSKQEASYLEQVTTEQRKVHAKDWK